MKTELSHMSIELISAENERNANIEWYKELMEDDPESVGLLGRIYISDGLYLYPNGRLEEE